MRSLLSWLVAAFLVCAVAGPVHASWHEAKSKHFIIYADLKPAELREFAERLERFDQAARRVRQMQDPDLTDSQRLTIYALRSEGAVARLAGNRRVGGFYNARASGSVAFVPRKAGSKSDWDLDAEEIFFHEYAHHLQLQYTSAALPAWVVEGFAEFFATAKVKKDGSVLVGSPPQYRAWGIFERSGLSLEQMLGGTYRRLNEAQMQALYGRGWLLMHYLSFEPSREGQLTRYIDGIQKGQGALESARSAFGDLRRLDSELNRYARKSLFGVLVDAKVLTVGPIAIRPLTEGEAAIMDVRIRSKRGVDGKTAPGVAADARKAAAPYPNDPFVQATLAEAEHDTRNYAAAEAAADRALAVKPTYVHALIYKGRAQLGLALENPATADWQQVRSWFIRANKADTENAESLMLFYQSYLVEGRPPTKNAVDALLYALELAPQDEMVRLMTVRQLLLDKQVAQARAAFAPLAFEPHAGAQRREWTMKIMDAITTGDANAALAAMEGPAAPTEDDAGAS